MHYQSIDQFITQQPLPYIELERAELKQHMALSGVVNRHDYP